MSHGLVRACRLFVCAAVAILAATEPLRGQDASPSRLAADIEALEIHRPGYQFWQQIFTIADGAIAFGSGTDGRLLAVFPSKGDWGSGKWTDSDLAVAVDMTSLPVRLDDRRTQMAEWLEPVVGPVLHNPTRGDFLQPNAQRYGRFIDEWSAIYERFGVPAELGLAQALIESGLNGTRKSEARAVGFCQWLPANWKQLNRLSPVVLEAGNQTTQASYCAAYLAVLATKYGSYIPALSDHHSGGVNVGRVIINGERLGGTSGREQYLLGSKLARDLRRIDLYGFRDLYRTYGPRSYLYAEMVFGNMSTIRNLAESTPQVPIFAMRTSRAITLSGITRATGLSADEIRRYNPALSKRVPAHADLYLPRYIKAFGADVSFWHRTPNAAYAAALNDFLSIDASAQEWDDGSLVPTLRRFEKRFRDSKSEEGTVMATMLEFVIGDAATSGRREILAEFRSDSTVRSLFDRALLQRVNTNLTALACSPDVDSQGPEPSTC
jgi:hypothetical protein